MRNFFISWDSGAIYTTIEQCAFVHVNPENVTMGYHDSCMFRLN